MRAWAVVSGVAMVTLLVIESGLACSNARGVWFHYHDRPGVERARFLAGELGVLAEGPVFHDTGKVLIEVTGLHAERLENMLVRERSQRLPRDPL